MELQGLREDFEKSGIGIVAVSSNSRELAEDTVKEWELGELTIGYGLKPEDAEAWGLFGSAALKDTEPDLFTEPGLFLVRPDGTLYASIVQTMPFSRPPMRAFLKSIQWIIENDYPARGEAALG